MDTPGTRYAKAPDGTSIAYQVIGDGPVTLAYSGGIWSNVDLMWEEPAWAHFLERLAACSRLIVFDMRGFGLSDRGPEPPSIELQRDDIAAVMDAAGVDEAVVYGGARASSMAMLFAATHPERTKGLILYAPVAKTVATPDFPHGNTAELQQALFERFLREVGTGRNLALQAPSVADDERFVAWWARFERSVASPSAYDELVRIFTALDVREVLPAIHVPTLVIHRTGDRMVSSAQARYVADAIEGARLVELPGDDHVPFVGDADAIADEVEEFLTGTRPARVADRILATVLFTDIVGSTERQVALGDRGWKDLVERHHAVVRQQLGRFRGLEQDTAGDGFYARFDGPGRAIACAQEIVHAVRPLGIEVRAGLHTGECELVEAKCSGLSVSIGARVMSHAGPSEILVSQTVKDLTAGSGLAFEDAGEHELKGVPDPLAPLPRRGRSREPDRPRAPLRGRHLRTRYGDGSARSVPASDSRPEVPCSVSYRRSPGRPDTRRRVPDPGPVDPERSGSPDALGRAHHRSAPEHP
ncbi:MAG: alpha/beta fold hydrolase [Actinomycetota bacterium]